MALSVGLKGTPTFHHLHLKTPLPALLTALQPYSITLFLSNEMDVWIPDEQHTALLPITVAITTSAKHAAHPHAHQLPSLHVLPPSKPLIHRNGRGLFDVAIASSAACCPFYIHFALLGPLAPTTLTAISGPHTLQSPGRRGGAAVERQKAAEAEGGEVEVWHSFPVAPSVSGGCTTVTAAAAGGGYPYLLVREVCGTFIGGRVWDCALYLMQYVREEMLAGEAGKVGLDAFVGHRMVELGSGTGVFSLWLYSLLNQHIASQRKQYRTASPPALSHDDHPTSATPAPPSVQVPTTSLLLTDQPEAMELLQSNIATTLTLNPPTTPNTLTLTSAPLTFGHPPHLTPLTPPTTPHHSLLLASDVVFNPAYFTALLRTMCGLLGLGGRALMAYRPRGGVGGREDARFWKGVLECGMRYTIVKRYANVFIVWIERGDKHLPSGMLTNTDERHGDGDG